MTPFAQLEKKAYGQPAAGYQYAQGPTGLNNPYAPHVAEGGKQPGGRHWGWDAGELGADVALGWNPLTGIPWFGGKAIHDFSKGNWGSGLMNAGFGALSAIGLGGAGAGIKAGISGAKTVGKLGKFGAGVKNVAGKPGFRTGAPVAAGVGMGFFGGDQAPMQGHAGQQAAQKAPQTLPQYMAQSMILNRPA